MPPFFLDASYEIEILVNPQKEPVNFTYDVVSQIDPNDDDIENIEISLEGLNESFMSWNKEEKLIEF